MNAKNFIIAFGIISILISLGTWIMEWLNFVEPCIYCRTERTIIGILGLLMLLPKYKYLTPYLGILIGFFGAFVATDQVFSNMIEGKFGTMIILATGALVIITAQVYILIYSSIYQSTIDPNN